MRRVSPCQIQRASARARAEHPAVAGQHDHAFRRRRRRDRAELPLSRDQGGDLRYEPAPSGGACFIIALPRAAPGCQPVLYHLYLLRR